MDIKRTFKFHERLKQGPGEAIIDIPHPSVLRVRSPQELLDSFESTWGCRPVGVALPVVAPDGLMYDCDGLQLPLSKYSERGQKYSGFPETVGAFADLGCNIYLLLDPTLPFIRADALHIVDIKGSGSAQACFGNPRAREVLAAILGTGADITLNALNHSARREKRKLAGMVLDAVDLWPMSATKNRIELTCFCESCRPFFAAGGLINKFQTYPNPWNLALRDQGSGLGYISALSSKSTPQDLVGLSRQRGFATEAFGAQVDDPSLLVQAEYLLKYIETRHLLTITALEDVFRQALDGLEKYVQELPKRIVLTEGDHYGWTTGLQLDRLDRHLQAGDVNPCDEVWFDPVSSDTYLRLMPFRSYMWRRTRYYVDAFFALLANAADPVLRATTGLAYLTEKDVRDVLRGRLGTAIGGAYTGATALAALPDLKGAGEKGSQRLGFVGVALTREIGETLVNDLAIAEGGRRASRAERQASLFRMLQSTGNDEEDAANVD